MSTPYLDTAAEIGRRLVREAIWHEGLCNWVGALPEPGPGDSIAITYAALGGDLYGGTSGVALYLAELYLATGEESLRATALGALRQALSSSRELDEHSRVALYAGGLGVALVAARVAALLGEQEPLAALPSLTDVAPTADGERDLMSGDAGAVLALLALERLTGEQALRERACAFGEQLLASARERSGMLSWASLGAPGSPHLTGLSHGASGCALALLELWRATAESAYLQAAERAFAYERSLFDPDAANWPDLRAAAPARSFAALWCHGAGGIALARLHAERLAAGAQAGAEARVALDTTARALAGELAQGGNFSLCHGLAGNAEILLHGHAELGAERDRDAELAFRAADEGIERHAPGGAWPCGTFEGQTPGLFLGLAGIGRFYLRLHEPRLPSLLLALPDQLGATRSPAGAGRSRGRRAARSAPA